MESGIISTHPDYWGAEYRVTVRMSRNIPEDKQAEILTRVYMWQELTPTGERSDGGATIYGRPMHIFGNVGVNGLNVNFLGD